MMADRGLQFETLRAGDFHQRLASSNGLAVVMFSGPACGTCRSVASRLPEVAARAGISELFLVDVETCTAIAREFEISTYRLCFYIKTGSSTRKSNPQ